MVDVTLECILKGTKFSEEEIINDTGLVIDSVIEKKKSITINGYKKAATVLPEQNNIFEEDYIELIQRFVELIQPHIRKFKNLGCELIALLMTVEYYDQCNFEFTNSVLKKISETFDEFYITCYKSE